MYELVIRENKKHKFNIYVSLNYGTEYVLTYSFFIQHILGFKSPDVIAWNFQEVEHFLGSLRGTVNNLNPIVFDNSQQAEEFVDKVNAHLMMEKLSM